MLRRNFLQAFPLAFALRADAPLARFDKLMRDIIRAQRLPGGSLSVAKDGRLVYARGFGLASVEGRIPVRPTTMFGLASVSKAITAIAVLKLVDQGRLGLEDRAYEILREITPLPGHRIDPRTRQITVRQLLNHSSGYTEQPDKAEVSRQLGIPRPKLREFDLIKAFRGHPLGFDPGTKEVYSNFGFVVAGAIVEKIMGMAYGPAIHQLMFRPLGITRPRVGHGGPERPDTARPYDQQGRPMPPIDIPGAPAGGWISSTPDLVRFLVGINSPFLSKDVVREMLRQPDPPLKPRGNGTWYGLGWDGVRQTPRGPAYSKNGGMGGVRAVIGHQPGNVDWAVAFNGGRDIKGQLGVDAEALKDIQEAVTQATDWPDGDLFPEMLRAEAR
jgi:N-acyl-D-amino-acid deacylase